MKKNDKNYPVDTFGSATGILCLDDNLNLAFCVADYGYSFSEIRPIDNLKNNHTPILFMHGADDTYVPTYMSQDMYEANAGYKEICLFEGAKHAKSIAGDPERYFEVLRDFLGRVYN